jgi:hypothetical protein
LTLTTKNKQIVGIEAHDSFELGTARTITPEGFLEAPATIARSGVQLYRAGELGLDSYGLPATQIVRLHRPTEELFRPETIASFQGKPVINGTHKTVTAANWKELSVGDIFDPQPDDKTLKVSRMSVKDKGAIGDINSGKKFLSIGYKFDIDMTPGTTATGDAYDGIQRNIIGNHVLITATPRGGPVCAIADSATVKEEKRIMKKVTVNGVPVEVGDSEAGIIEAIQGQLTAALAKPATITYLGTQYAGDAIIALLTEKDAKIKTIGDSQLTEAQVEERVAARVAVVGDASKLVADYDAKGKTNKQIFTETLTTVTSGDETTKAVVNAILGGKTIGDASEEALGTAFRAVAASKPAVAKQEVSAGDSLGNLLLMGKESGDNTTGKKDGSEPVGREAFILRQNSAWQKK